MTPTERHFDTRPDEFEVSIDGEGTLLSAEWRKNIEEKEDGTFDARCCYVPLFAPATRESVANALVGIFFKCQDEDKGSVIEFYTRAQAFAESLFPQA